MDAEKTRMHTVTNYARDSRDPRGACKNNWYTGG